MRFEKEILDLYTKLMQDPSVDPAFDSMYQKAKDEFQDLFDKVFTIEHYRDNPSYEKLKEFLIDRFAKLKALATYSTKKNTPLTQLPEFAIDSIFDTFGFSRFKNLKEDDKRLLVQNIVNLIQKKGTKILEDVLQILLRYTDVNLQDLDLIRESNNTWSLINPQTGARYRIGKIADSHWLTDLDQLSKRVDEEHIPPQFRTPFFTLTANKVSINDLTTIILFINLIVRDELRLYTKTGQFSSSIYIDLFDINLSFTELWLFTITLYKTYIAITTGDEDYLNPHPSEVIVFDEDIIVTDSTKTEVFNAIAQINNQQLKELTYDYYMEHYDELEEVTYEDFDSYLAANWDDYYALEPEIRTSLIASAFFYMKLSKRKTFEFYIDSLWAELTRLPKDYIEKYVSCVEDPTKGLLYVFYDHFVKTWDNSGSEIVEKIIKNAEGQLSIINDKLVRFKDKLVESYQDGDITKDEIRALIVYFLLQVASYLFKQYDIKFPIDYFFGIALNFYSTSTIRDVIDLLKPVYARPIFGSSTTKLEIDIPVLYSIRYLLEDFMTIWQRLYDSEVVVEHLRFTIKLRFADIVNNLTHVYRWLDPNFMVHALNHKQTLYINNCTNINYNISNIKSLKDLWLCCDQDIAYDCGWCNNTVHIDPNTNYDYKTTIIENYECIKEPLYDGSIIQTIRYKFNLIDQFGAFYDYVEIDSQESYFDLDKTTALKYALVRLDRLEYTYVPHNDVPTHALNEQYFDKYKILLNDDIETWILNAIQDRPLYSIFDIVDDLLSDPILSFLAITNEYLQQTIRQRNQFTLTYNDFLTYKIHQALRDTVNIYCQRNLIIRQRIEDNMCNDVYNATTYNNSSYNMPCKTFDLLRAVKISQMLNDVISYDDKLGYTSSKSLVDTYTTTDSNKIDTNQILEDSTQSNYYDELDLNLVGTGKFDEPYTSYDSTQTFG